MTKKKAEMGREEKSERVELEIIAAKSTRSGKRFNTQGRVLVN